MLRLSGIILLSILLINYRPVSGQELPMAPTPPNTAGITQMGNSSVNLYTGTASISIPLYSYTSKKLSLPISLTYQGKAFKVQDIAGPVGLGWSLQLGGCITRSLRGLPDEQVNGYAADSTVTATGAKVSADYTSTGYADVIKKVSISEWDGEPDVFTSSVGGKFVLNSNKQPVFSVQNGYKVIQDGLYPTAEINRPWIIADPYGNKYYFGGGLNTTETVKYVSGTFTSKPYVNAWYLNKIVSADGQDSIVLGYFIGNTSLNYTYYKRVHIEKYFPCFVNESYDRDENFEVRTTDPKCLGFIDASNLNIKLLYEDRADLTGASCVKEMIISNKDESGSNELNHYVFKYGYFIDADRNANARLKLSAIYTLDSLNMRRVYASFVYNEVALPPRSSVKFDHWGYYNSNASGTSLPPLADKQVDTIRTQANMLTRINWAAGAFTTYKYEQNTAVVQDTVKLVGGVRIASITTNEPVSGNKLSVKYRYLLENGESSGLLYNSFPQSYYKFKLYASNNAFGNDPVGNDPCEGYIETTQDQTYADLFDVYGISLGYSRVEVQNADSSREENIYTDLKDWDNDKRSLYMVRSTSPASLLNSSARFGPPYSSVTSYGFMRGLLKEKRLYNAANMLQGVSRYKYDTYIKTDNRIFGMRGMIMMLSNGGVWYGGKYEEFSSLAQLIGIREVGYPGNTTADSIVTVKRLEYNTKSPSLISRSISSIDNRDSVIIKYTYPGDFIEDPLGNVADAYVKMVNNNMIAFPLEEVHLLQRENQSKVINASVNKYKVETLNNVTVPLFFAKMVLKLDRPLTSYSWLTKTGVYDSNYEESFSIDKYDNKGNITQYTTKASMSHATIWDGYTSAYKLAEVANAVQGEFYYMGFELGSFGLDYNSTSIRTDGGHTGKVYYTKNVALIFTPPNSKTYNVSYWYKKDAKWNYSGKLNYKKNMILTSYDGLDDIRILPDNARMTTYAYEPLVGLTSETGDNGKTQFYEYDDEQHLKLIRDNDRNIVKLLSYEYNVPSVSGDLACAKVTGPITITRIAADKWNVKWIPIAGVASYKVEYRKESDDNWFSVNVTGDNCDLSYLGRVTVYEVRITALCQNSNRVQPSDIQSFKTSQIALTLDFTLSNNSSGNNYMLLTATITGYSGVPITIKWGGCTVNNTIDPNLQYCYGIPGQTNSADYTTSIIPYNVSTYTGQSVTTTPGSTYGDIKKVVIFGVQGIDAWDIQKGSRGIYEFVVQ